MERAGMVHALEELHRMLVQGGFLIDLHPRAEASSAEVHKDRRVLFAERPPDDNADWEDYRHAELALSEVIERRLFQVEDVRGFDFVTSADSVAELQQALETASAFSTSERDPGVLERRLAFGARLHEITRHAGAGAEVAYREPARATRLRRLG
jgi:hypothetical protein